MGVKWTTDQEKAISTTDKGVVVSAAAGSGKTAVLIERTIRLLADKKKNISADTLLAVTFTVDATTQMREKLSKAFDEKILSETSSEQKKWLQQQQDKLAMAKINTINAFCLDLVKNNIHEFELQGGVKILDDVDAQVILSEAVQRALDELSLNSPDDLDFLVDTLTENDEKNVAEIVLRLYKFLSSLPFPHSWIEDINKSFSDDDIIKKHVKKACEDYIEIIEKAMKQNEIVTNVAYSFNKKYNCGEKVAVALNSDYEMFKEMLKILDSQNWQDIYNYFKKLKYATMSFKFPKDEDADLKVLREAGKKQLQTSRDKYKDSIKKISESVKKIGENIKADLLVSEKIFNLLCSLCEKTKENAWSVKTAKNALEFSDVERMTIELLVKEEDGKIVRTALSGEIVNSHDFKVILIDEFQDVNNLQELIFKAISDTEDLSILGKNVFVVGDVKQSIYRFRQSNPQLFINARENAKNEKYYENLESIELKSNFRSRQNVIDFVNYLFENIMSVKVGELAYEGSEKLEKGANYEGENPTTEVMLVLPEDDEASSDDTDNTDEEDDENEYVLFTTENQVVANRIKQLIDEKHQVFDGGKLRDCRPSDFCVLSRGKETTSKISVALEMVGLKAFNEETSGYLRAREIAVMINLLKIIDNPMNDIPMVSVMMSSLMGFTAEDVTILRRECKSNGKYVNHFYQVLNSVYQWCMSNEKNQEEEFFKLEVIDEENEVIENATLAEEDVEDETPNAKQEDSEKEFKKNLLNLNDSALEEKCKRAVILLRKLRFYSCGMSLSRLIRKIYDDTGFFAVASAYENSKQKRANLRLLLEYASTYENSGEGSVSGFVRYLESVSESGKDFNQAVTVTEGGDSVFVKTIHKSKGLEYPFIFLSGVSKKFNMTDVSKQMLIDEREGIGFKIYNHENLSITQTVSHKALSIISKDKTLSEEMRLLYVALTRAKEKIFIPVVMKKSAKKEYDTQALVNNLAKEISQAGGISDTIVRKCNSYFEWLATILLCYAENEKFLETMAVEVEVPTIQTNAKIDFNIIKNTDIKTDSKPVFEAATADENLVEKLVKRYSFKYNDTEIDVPSKLTVTEIVSMEKELEMGARNPEYYPQLPKLSTELGKLSSAEKGTCTHLFMEVANYEKASISVKDELDRLVSEGFFTTRQAKCVYVDAVKKFFDNNFYSRMKNSKKILKEKQFLVSFSDLNLGEKYQSYKNAGSMLQGIADCIFKEDDGYVLVDYKTDNFKDENELYKYQTQLELYKAALDLLLDMPIKTCYIYSFRLSKGVEIKLTD